jgi:putative dehydrogenase
MKIGFVGLGAMGLPMAKRLLAQGHTVLGYDLYPHNRAAFEAAGGLWQDQAGGVTQGVDALWLMVVSGDQAQQFLLGDGHADALPAQAVVIVGCTQPASQAAALAQTLAARNLRMLDAPVSGGIVGAESGTLSIMVGAPSATLEAVRPLLQAVGSNVFHMGETCGMGSTMKMVNQLLCGVHIAVAAEALHLAQNAGLNAEQVIEIIGVSAGNSWMFSNRGPRMLQDEPPVASAVDIFIKDLGIVTDEARKLKTGLPLASSALQLFLAASGQGHGKADDSQVIRAYRGMNRGEKT